MAQFLRDKNIQEFSIHGDLEQRDRDQILLRFSKPLLFWTERTVGTRYGYFRGVPQKLVRGTTHQK